MCTTPRGHNWIAIGTNDVTWDTLLSWYDAAIIFDPTMYQFQRQDARVVWKAAECMAVKQFLTADMQNVAVVSGLLVKTYDPNAL